MAKPLSEHSTTIKAKKADKRDDEDVVFHEHDDRLEPVGGGSVRRIVFEGREPKYEEVEEGPDRRDWRPRHHASMDDIHFEVDHINRWRKNDLPSSGDFRSRRLYETAGGDVSETVRDTDRGRKRDLYTGRRKRGYTEETRFSEAAVDRLIAERRPRETEASEGTTVRRRVTTTTTTTKGGKASTQTESSESIERPKKAKRKLTKKSSKKHAEKKAVEAAAPKGDYEPQCAALANSGKQCRNSSKHGSKYCGAHQGYKPKKLEDVLDTVPKRAADTAPGTGDQVGTGQCAAYTGAGLQCKNGSRKNSKYCGKHKGYRAPSKDQLAARLDTKPRFAKARDTAPTVK